MRFEPLFDWWAIALLLVPFIVWIGWLFIRWFVKKDPSLSLWQVVRSASIVVCLVLIVVGPSVPGGKAPAGMVNVDAVIVVDRTASISAEDYDGNKPRLEGVKKDVLRLVESLRGARIALVTTDSEARVRVPFTSDTSSISTAIEVLDQEVALYSSGTNIGLPVDSVVRLLKKSQDAYPEKGRLFFYVGDGEQIVDEKPKSFSVIKPYISGGAVLGYGTEAGGRMKTYYGYGDYEPSTPYIEDLTSYSAENNYGFSEAISKIDEQNLRTIANDTGTTYTHRSSIDQPISQVIDNSKMFSVADSHRQIMFYVNLYWVFAIMLVLLLGWWFLDMSRVIFSGIKKGDDS